MPEARGLQTRSKWHAWKLRSAESRKRGIMDAWKIDGEDYRISAPA